MRLGVRNYLKEKRMKNYYQILNVSKTANDAEIKRSYRVLAKRYHPDLNPGDQEVADKFADINVAYEVLSDSVKRAEYDKQLAQANAPKQRPEDIIARQRAAAQAAARQAAAAQAAQQAAAQQALRNQMRESLRNGTDPSIIIAQRAAAQAAAAQQAAAQAQARAQQYQAQLSEVEKRAHEAGIAEGKRVSASEIKKLKSDIHALKSENSQLRTKVAESENDCSELEQELFDRDREYNEQRLRADELEKQLNTLKHSAPSSKRSSQKDLEAENEALKAEIMELKERIHVAESERKQAELKAKAQLELQQQKRRELVESVDELMAEIGELNDEIAELQAQNEKWEQYAKSEDFLSAAEKKIQEWEKKQRADKKLARGTLYGTLGVLIWATDDEITTAYNKLVKRYGSKADDASKEKLEAVKYAYDILSDQDKRLGYNESINITVDRMSEERELIAEYAKLEEEYRNSLDDKEFWEWFDELTFNAQTGDAESQNRLGEMYYYGDEIEKDIDQAVYWYKEAAKQKNADAMYNLGICFINGEGVELNVPTGEGFIRQAARLGSKSAKDYMQKKGK